MPGYEKIESLKNGGSWGQFCWKTCGFERVNGWLPSKPNITLANLAKVDKFLLAK